MRGPWPTLQLRGFSYDTLHKVCCGGGGHAVDEVGSERLGMQPGWEGSRPFGEPEQRYGDFIANEPQGRAVREPSGDIDLPGTAVQETVQSALAHAIRPVYGFAELGLRAWVRLAVLY